MKEAIYKLNIHGRHGRLDGLFIANKEDVEKLINESIDLYFGEVLGKHSEICGNLEEDEVIFISDDENLIQMVRNNNLEIGYNPFDYVSDPNIFNKC